MLSKSLGVAATLLLHELQFSLKVCDAVKNLPDSAEDMSSIPGREGPLEKGMAAHSSILACKIPWTEEPGGLQSMELQRIGCNLVTEQQQLSIEAYLAA